MDDTLEVRCEKCDCLYATVEPREGGTFALNVLEPGMEIEPVSVAERFGRLVCACGHRTPVDLALFGIP